MSLRLHSYWRSSASYRVRIALHLKQLDFDYIPVHLVKNNGEQKSDEYANLNPSMLVPTFIDDDADILLNQSLAIIEYLDERYPSISPLLPKQLPLTEPMSPEQTIQNSFDRARIRAFAQDIACDVQPLANLRVMNVLKSEFNASDEQSQQWTEGWIKKGFAATESRLKSTAGKYCFGYTVTLADLCLIPQVYNAKRFNISLKQFPTIEKIWNNCNELEAFKKAAPEAQPDAQVQK